MVRPMNLMAIFTAMRPGIYIHSSAASPRYNRVISCNRRKHDAFDQHLERLGGPPKVFSRMVTCKCTIGMYGCDGRLLQQPAICKSRLASSMSNIINHIEKSNKGSEAEDF